MSSTISLDTKIVGSSDYNKRKVLASDINQIKGALQTGTYDIKPNDINMEGNVITADSGQDWIRRSSNKFQFYDAGTWKEPATLETATFTAGEAISIRDVVYVNTSDGKIYKASSSNSDWIGVASEAISSGSSGQVYLNGSLVGGFSGLTAGKTYGLNSTSGAIEISNNYQVGQTISATQIKLIKDSAKLNNSFDNIYLYNLPVTTVSANKNLSALNNIYSITIKNTGSLDCYFDLGATATTSGIWLKSGADIELLNCSFDYISAITSSGTTTLSIMVKTKSQKEGDFTNKEILNLSVTSTSSTDSFTDTTHYKSIIISNSGISDCYVKLDSTATTSDFLIPSEDSLIINNTKDYNVAAICSAGETTTIKVLGVY